MIDDDYDPYSDPADPEFDGNNGTHFDYSMLMNEVEIPSVYRNIIVWTIIVCISAFMIVRLTLNA